MGPHPRVLLVFSGQDQPGLTAMVIRRISDDAVRLIDLDQAVVGDYFLLSLLVETEPGDLPPSLAERWHSFAREHQLQLDIRNVQGVARPPTEQRSYIITCIGRPIDLGLFSRLMGVLAEHAVRIYRIRDLSPAETAAAEGIFCIELQARSDQPLQTDGIRGIFRTPDTGSPLDVVVQAEHLYRLPKRLIVIDMDSTLVQMEGIDELAREAGVMDQVAAITRRAMNGEIPFSAALRERVGLLRGLPAEALKRVHGRMAFTPGAKELLRTLKALGLKAAVLSGGFDFFTDRIKEELSLDYTHANRLEIRDGKLTGELLGEVIDGAGKASLMEEIARKEGIRLEQVIAVGDGANDLPMITRAGMGIAFNAKPKVREQAPISLTQNSLESVLYLLGIDDRHRMALLKEGS